MKSKILVLGASSFAGSSFISLSIKTGVFKKIVGVYNTYVPITFSQMQNQKQTNLRLIKLNFSKDAKKLIKIIETFKPEQIIDFSSICMVAESWQMPEKYFSYNIQSKIPLLKVLTKFKFIKKYIYISTPEVFGNTKNKSLNEKNTNYNPSTPYALSKLSFEMLLQTYLKNFDLPIIITRFSNFYGPYQPLHRLIPKLNYCINQKMKFPLQGDGKSKRNFIYIDDFFSGLLSVLKKGKKGKIYHFSGKELWSVNKIIELICKQKKVTISKIIKRTNDRKGKDPIYKLSCSETMKELNWRPKVSIKKGVLKTLNFYDRNPHLLNKNSMNYKFNK